jgi:N-acetylneuraminate synthase
MNFYIGSQSVSSIDAKAYVIAECADAHMGNLDMACAMATAAANAGADAVKFQHHLPDEEMLPGTPMSDNMSEPLYDWLKKHALTLEQHRKLKEHCDFEGITYLCTPFSWKAAQEIEPLVPVFKVGSGEAQDYPFLDRLAKIGKPVIVSTGMCDWPEVETLYEYLDSRFRSFALCHCLSEYPPRAGDLNIAVVERMAERFRCVIGYSCHAPYIYPAIAAHALGATIIEKHVTLHPAIEGPDRDVSITFAELGDLCHALHINGMAMGDDKRLQDMERPIRNWAYRSLVVTKDLHPGDVLSEGNLWSKRPGNGILSREMPLYLGRKVVHHVKANTQLRVEDVEDIPCV